jgi:ribosome-associated toxin RatA of RatAB toxin-antitoxin module
MNPHVVKKKRLLNHQNSLLTISLHVKFNHITQSYISPVTLEVLSPVVGELAAEGPD